MKLTNHNQELRKRTTTDLSEPKITDQSYKKSCDINNIMKQYAKTGMFTHLNSQPLKYIDNTTIPNLEQSFEIVRNAHKLFYELPSDIRKLMDNNPANLESFVNNPKNEKILKENGLIVEKVIPKPSEIQLLTEAIKNSSIKTDNKNTGGKNGEIS